jgi:glyoxylase-like metal-dependent hydrolase (beta-lactamase superfamily II)
VRDALERHGIRVFERGWLSSNNILVRGDANHGATLVDTGYWTHAEQTVALLKHALGGAPLGRILNTHLHSDHCGGNAAVSEAFDCGIDVPAGEADAVDQWDEARLTYRATGQHCPRFRREGVIVAGGEVQVGRWRWQVIASPGHDPMSVALYQPELEVLVSADALWENGFGVVFPELEGNDAFDQVAATLDRFETLSVRWVIPGHGSPFGEVAQAIARARSRLDTFVKDPHKHALHAAKVLVKFRLLETQAESWETLLAWLSAASYFDEVRRRHFGGVDTETWLRGLVDDMCRRGALEMRDGTVFNGT